ncbi:ABC transporter permease [uncultured Legionella sp.]|uniref:ABC transporter permease n=1 Tax=uncultured Legionella sp. TaxID=210934 RepID=UPI0026208BE9|nr:ABC transporter permease [uncultured Legionella sp.]
MPTALINKTILSKQEKNWILEQRVTRLSDQQEVLIYPMGAERYLSLALSGIKKDRYNIKADIEGKSVLVIPGYGNSCFLFAQSGAKSITVYDKDPVTIAWVKAFKKYYHYREYSEKGTPYPSIGELLTALTRWYPPRLTLPSGKFINTVYWLLTPKSLRRKYIYYMLHLVQQAIQNKEQDIFELEHNIQFHAGELKHLLSNKNNSFDTAFVPYLLGVTNGIEKKEEIVQFIKQIIQLVPEGILIVSPSQNKKEFYLLGQSYFVTTGYPNIASLPGLESLVIKEDKEWFKTQGLTAFRVPSNSK